MEKIPFLPFSRSFKSVEMQETVCTVMSEKLY